MRRLVPLIALLAGTVALGCGNRQQGLPKDTGPPKVTVAAPLVRPVTEFTEMTGTLAAVKTADVRARVTGYVQRVVFEEGAEVKAGQELIVIDPEPFRLALGQAETNVKSSTAQHKLAQATEGRVKKAFEAGGASQDEYEQAKSQALVTQASVEKAKKDVEQAEL